MHISENISGARAFVRVHHERPFDYDEKRGLWVYRQVDEDEVAGNIVTNAGRVAIHTYVYGTAGQRSGVISGTGLNYIALSNNATTPDPADTDFGANELTTNGLQRAQGTVTLPTGSNNITTIANTFTYTGSSAQGVQKTALFDAITNGRMAHEIQFQQRTLYQNDTLTVTFSIVLG